MYYVVNGLTDDSTVCYEVDGLTNDSTVYYEVDGLTDDGVLLEHLHYGQLVQ